MFLRCFLFLRALLVPLLLLVGAFASPASAFSEDAALAARVVILANADDVDSLRIASHYAAARGVPQVNIVALPLSREETITWAQFVQTLWEPLQAELVKRKWIDVLRGHRRDPAGRLRTAGLGHHISYLVVCRGVPLRIEHAEEFYAESADIDRRPRFRINAAAVDSELSLLAYGDYNINAYVPNPLFKGGETGLHGRARDPIRSLSAILTAEHIIKVARLDGPRVADVISLIDRTLEAEARGLRGRSYVDVRGPYPEGDAWMEAIATRAEQLGFETTVNREKGNFPASADFTAPVLYFGWYAADVEGPFTKPGFRFEPGAIAVHVHSYSAATLRSASKRWAGPLIARGAVATVGAVYEPFLQMMHWPHLLFDALARGERLGDAAYTALPVLSWQNLLIGDPLYRPFSRELE